VTILDRRKIKVHNIYHFLDLLKRGHAYFRLEAVVQPSGELRGKDLYGVHQPTEILAANGKVSISNCFEYDACMMVLSEPDRYEATIYCHGDWSAHDEAEEIRKWEQA
jgi:hypothetical protein